VVDSQKRLSSFVGPAVSFVIVILKGKCYSLQEKVRLKYKVSYQVDGLPNTETGEVDSFPSAND